VLCERADVELMADLPGSVRYCDFALERL
jgi:hypothetical protein